MFLLSERRELTLGEITLPQEQTVGIREPDTGPRGQHLAPPAPLEPWGSPVLRTLSLRVSCDLSGCDLAQSLV